MVQFSSINSQAKRILADYITQSANMALALQGETSYTGAFSVVVQENGFLFIPRLPASFLIDDQLYERIFKIANVALYPQYTLIKHPAMVLVPLTTDDIHVQRALYFPWIKGIPERLIIPDLEAFARQSVGSKTIPIMKNGLASINLNRMTSVLIAGTSGGGKSYLLTYLLEMFKAANSELIVIDPKGDSPTRWALENKIPVFYPHANRSKSEFLNLVNEQLSWALNTIYERQQELLKNPKTQFRRKTLVIDEVLALTEGVQKSIKESFFSLLSEIALLGRATKVGLILVSQRFDHQTIPVSVREQANTLVQIGHITSKTTQFLFPDLNPEGIVIPTGHGTGFIKTIGPKQPHIVLPLLCPTYTIKRGIIS